MELKGATPKSLRVKIQRKHLRDEQAETGEGHENSRFELDAGLTSGTGMTKPPYRRQNLAKEWEAEQ